MLPSDIVQCPYCWEDIEIVYEPDEGSDEFVCDCTVCCHPINFQVVGDAQGETYLLARSDDE
ncbi:MAG TPA: CPXCG motif-containing cysteine-rich protein [Marinobacterium sp.]|nr:CPXCG motif-containing cysteine-rich protein [Marinobacterium sp.]